MAWNELKYEIRSHITVLTILTSGKDPNVADLTFIDYLRFLERSMQLLTEKYSEEER